MAGMDRTNSLTDDGTVAAMVLPRRWAATVPGEYSESDPTPGRDRYAGATRTRLDLQGSPSYRDASDADATPTQITAQALPTGSTTPAGCWAWQRDGAGPWYGWDRPAVVSGYAMVSGMSGGWSAYAPSCLVLQSGVMLAAWGESDGTSVRILTRRRVGVQWTEAEVSIDSIEQVAVHNGPTTLVQLEDGSVLLLTLQSVQASRWELVVLRSTDDGETWAIHSMGALRWSTTAPRVLRATVTKGQVIALYASIGTTTGTRVSSWTSIDGAIWTPRDVALGASVDGLVVWDARTIRGTVWLVVEYGSGGSSTGLGYVDVDPTVGIDTAAITLVLALGTDEDWIAGGAIAEDPASDTGLYILAAPTGSIWRVRSDEDRLASPLDGGSGQVAAGQIAWWRGALCSVSTRRETATISGDCIEVRIGGQSDLTWMRDLDRYGDDTPPTGWTAIDSGINNVWPNGDLGGGTVTRSYARATGQRIQTDASVTAVHGPSYGTPRRMVIMGWRLRVAAGTARVSLAATDGSSSWSVTVDITGTQIRAYDATGTASSYTPHGGDAAEYMTIHAALYVYADGGSASARVYWSTGGETYPRQTTGRLLVSGISSTAASTTTRSQLRVQPSSDVYTLWVWAGSRQRLSPYQLPSQGQPYDVAGVPLSGGSVRYLADGLRARVTGVPVAVDGVEHDVYITGPRPREAIDPFRAPSPRQVWRMPADVDQVIRLTPAEGATQRHTHTAAWVLYLAGLRSVPSIQIEGGTIATTTRDLRTAVEYEEEGWTVRPATTGSRVLGQWVGEGDLVGSAFELSDGTVRTITANSAGALTSGTVSEHRAVITLDGTAAGTSGTGYIWPREVAIQLQHATLTPHDAEYVITIPDTVDTVTGETYREIGILALGPAHLLGIAPDRTMAWEARLGDDLAEQVDGSVSVISRRPPVDRVEFAWVASPHEVTDMHGPRSSASSPDYVTTSWLEEPSGVADPVEAVRSMVRTHGRHPLILASLPATDPDDGVTVIGPVPWRQGVYLVHIEGDPRTEETPTQGGRMVRLSLLAGRRVT